MRYEVYVYLKAGQAIAFTADKVTVTTDEADPQRIKEFTWENAAPALLFIHVDNIAAVLTRKMK